MFAFLLDQWSHLLEAQHQQQPAAATAAAAGQAGVVQPHIPGPMLEWMHEKVNVSVLCGLHLTTDKSQVVVHEVA